MREGKIKKKNGKTYQSTHDYIKVFKAFWNWQIRTNKKKSIEVPDITQDLSGAAEHKPDFVYFTLESLQKMMDRAKYDYK